MSKNAKKQNASPEDMAVVYARYSSHKQGEQSIDGQLAAAKQYAAAHGLTIVHEYIDRATTGTNDNREAFQQMLADTSKHQFGVIIVWKIDRFGRNREEIAFNRYRCKKNGVKLVYVAECVPDAPEGIILESVLEGMAEYYSVQLATNVKRGMRMSAQNGKSVGGALPMGYRTGSDKQLEVDPQTAPVVKFIFDSYASGMTQKQIIVVLNEKGLRNKKGDPFTWNSLQHLLKNRKYIGIYEYDGKVEGRIPAIISEDTFEKVQRMLQVNSRTTHRVWTKHDYLLTGKLFCGLCGSSMIGGRGTSKTGESYYYYNCVNHKKGGCRKRAVRQEWLESLVLKYTKQIIFDDQLLNTIADKVYDYCQQEKEDTSYADMIDSELKEVNTSINNLIKALETGAQSSSITQRIQELENQRSELKAALADAQMSTGLRMTKEKILYFLLQFRQYDFNDPDCQARIIHTFINSIFIYEDKLVIAFNHSGEGAKITVTDIENLCSCTDGNGSPKGILSFRVPFFFTFFPAEALRRGLPRACGNLRPMAGIPTQWWEYLIPVSKAFTGSRISFLVGIPEGGRTPPYKRESGSPRPISPPAEAQPVPHPRRPTYQECPRAGGCLKSPVFWGKSRSCRPRRAKRSPYASAGLPRRMLVCRSGGKTGFSAKRSISSLRSISARGIPGKRVFRREFPLHDPASGQKSFLKSEILNFF